jgi:hypothetical protein
MLEQQNEKATAFNYTYSPKQQDDIDAIKQKYMEKNECKTDKILRLDQNVNRKGTIVSIVVGIVGMMLLGIGMSLLFTIGGMMYIFGSVIGLIGVGVIAAAYPLYIITIKKERKKIAPIIMKLIEELEN